MCIFACSPRGWCHTGIRIYLHANQPGSNSFHSNTFRGLYPKWILYSEEKKQLSKAELTFYLLVITSAFGNNQPAPWSLLKIIKLYSLPPKHHRCAHIYIITHREQVKVSSDLSSLDGWWKWQNVQETAWKKEKV